MAGTTKRDIELTVRGRNLSQQPMREVETSIKAVTVALSEQLEAAKRGEVGADELASSMRQLKDAGEALIRQQGLIDRFRLLSGALETASKRATDAQAAHAKLATEFSQLEAPTKAQASALDRSAKAAERAGNAVAKAQAALEKQGESLRELGIESNDLDQAQQKILNLANQTASSYNVLTTATNGLAKAERERKALAAQQASENRAAQLAEQEAEALRKQEAAMEALYQKEIAEARQQQRRADALAAFAPLLDRIEREELDLANSKALQEKLDRELAVFRSLADQVDVTAQSYRRFGESASSAAAGKSTSAAAGVRGIVDPAGAQLATAGGAGAQADALAATAAAAAKARQPVKEFTETMDGLRAVLKATQDQAKTLDAFSAQAAQVRGAEAAYAALTAEVARLEEEVRQAAAPSEALAAQLNAARTAATGAERSLANERATLDRLAAGMRTARLNTEELAQEEARLAATARTSKAAMDQLSATAEKYGEAVEDAGRKSSFFQVGERQSLSLLQRVRGEVLALTAAYVGLQAVLGLAGGAINAYVEKQAVENRLAVVVGNNQKEIGAEYDYVHGQAERLGIGIQELADQYSKFSIAAKNGNLSLEQRRFVFERITEVMRINHSSTEDIGRAWTQLEQILSKGRVQMDDLRAAANSLPGIETALAKGLQNLDPAKFGGLSDGIDKIIASKGKAQAIPILFKAMKDGAVDAKAAILALAEEYQRDYGERLPEALKALQAEQGRFNTGLYDFKLLVAQSGFADAYTQLLQKLSTFFKSDDGRKFAEEIGSGFQKLTEVLSFLVDNIDLVEEALKIIVEIKVISWTAGLIKNFGDMTKGLGDLSTALRTGNVDFGDFSKAATAGQKSLMLIKGALGVVSAGIIGWNIGTLIQEKFAVVRVVTQNFFAYLDVFGNTFWASLQSIIIRFTGAISDTFNEVLISFRKFGNSIGNTQAELYRAVGADALADKITNLFGDTSEMQAALDKRKAIRQKELDDIKAKVDRANKIALMSRTDIASQEGGNGPKANPSNTQTTKEPSEVGELNKTEDEKAERAAEVRARKIEALENQLAESLRGIDARVAKNQKDSLQDRLNAVDDTYQKIYTSLDKLQKLGGTKVTVKDATGDDVTYSIAQYKAQLESMKDVVKQQETEKFNKETLKQQEDDLNKLLEDRKNRLKDINDLLSSGGISAADAFTRSSAVLDELNPKIKAAAEEAKKFADNAVGKGVTQEQAGAFSSKAASAANGDVASRAQALDILKSGETQINGLISQRKDIIEANNNLVELGLKTERDAQDEIQQQNTQLGPQIEEQARRLLETLEKMHEAGSISDADFSLWSAKLQAAASQSEVLSASMTRAKTLLTDQFLQGGEQIFTSLYEGIGGVIDKTNSWGDALKNVRDTALNFLGDFLIAIAKAIIKQQLLNAIQAASVRSSENSVAAGGGTGAGIWGSVISGLASVLHTGGTVGAGSGMTRAAPAALWSNAPRYHTGTLVGSADQGSLKSDERRAILQVGEEVLSRDNPRNVLNAGRNGGNGNSTDVGQPDGDTHLHMHADSSSFLGAALNQRKGQKYLFAFIEANKSYFSKMLKS